MGSRRSSASTTSRFAAATRASCGGRQRQALDVNENIVQGLTVAKYELERGQDDRSRAAIEETLRKSRVLITDLLGERGSEVELGPGDLRRSESAAVTSGSSLP